MPRLGSSRSTDQESYQNQNQDSDNKTKTNTKAMTFKINKTQEHVKTLARDIQVQEQGQGSNVQYRE